MPIKWNTILGVFRKYWEAGSVAKQAISAIREALQPHTTHSFILGVVSEFFKLFTFFAFQSITTTLLKNLITNFNDYDHYLLG